MTRAKVIWVEFSDGSGFYFNGRMVSRMHKHYTEENGGPVGHYSDDAKTYHVRRMHGGQFKYVAKHFGK